MMTNMFPFVSDAGELIPLQNATAPEPEVESAENVQGGQERDKRLKFPPRVLQREVVVSPHLKHSIRPMGLFLQHISGERERGACCARTSASLPIDDYRYWRGKLLLQGGRRPFDLMRK
jgi:hypothetical protein